MPSVPDFQITPVAKLRDGDTLLDLRVEARVGLLRDGDDPGTTVLGVHITTLDGAPVGYAEITTSPDALRIIAARNLNRGDRT
ncbi:hypothetical protein SAMN04488550_0613 [Gordonia malaquae]|uniref:hypothetical protein n=1 Tax=Gordonia malaquae TaxID=410332 RepID=UPI00089432CF|nr:hypothetical protein [Gordonia malaquae]SEB68430.1 hypothetical protein SAMN04488550_0613 [Gordonia malaquae]